MTEHDTQTAPETPTTPDTAARQAAAPQPGAEPASSSPVAGASEEELEASIIAAIQEVYDPEIPVNIYELGLIYDVDIQEENHIAVKMTLTSPACPVAGTLPGEVRDKVLGVPGVADAEVEVVWDPVWNPSMMSEAAKLQLGML